MKRALLDISGKIDPFIMAIYEQIARVAKAQGVEFFIVGATARDLVLHHGYGIEVRRATRDIDLAVQVSNWDEFQNLKDSLIATGEFADTKMTQRLQYRESIPVDIVPFGAITEADGSINWPPNFATRMSILGFAEAYEDALPVRLNNGPEIEVYVASPTSLAALKLIAWKERAPGNTKDATDLIYIIQNYLDIGNHERLQNEHRDLMDDDFDYVRAGARLLGRDMAQVLSDAAIEAVRHILQTETTEGDKYPLVEDMSRGEPGEVLQENIQLLRKLEQGIADVVETR